MPSLSSGSPWKMLANATPSSSAARNEPPVMQASHVFRHQEAGSLERISREMPRKISANRRSISGV